MRVVGTEASVRAAVDRRVGGPPGCAQRLAPAAEPGTSPAYADTCGQHDSDSLDGCRTCCVSSCPTSPGRWAGWRPRSVRPAATSRRSRSSRSATTAPRVDDVLLEMADGTMPDSIVSACNELDGVQVVWISRYAAGGNLFLDLEAVEELTADPVARARPAGRPAAGDLPRRLGRAGPPGRGVVHGTEAAPDELAWTEVERPGRLEGPTTRTLVVACPLGSTATRSC